MLLILLVLQLCGTTYASIDFVNCLEKLQNQTFGKVVEGAVDANGYSVSDVTLAAGLTYPACMNLCGSGNKAFDGVSFSQQLVTWLLPWLALISQLPYGSNDVLKNFESMLLTVGSPMLAAYSLALAVTSNRWMVERFGRSNCRSSHFAAKVLSSLQQVLFSLPKEDHVFWSLVVLRENDEWWRRLASGLDYSSSLWTLSAIMSMVYVGLTYILTWMTMHFSDLQPVYAGQSIGSLWLSLLPLVVCYLQLSPKSDWNRINAALDHANELCFVAEERGEPTQHRASTITVQTAWRSIVDEDKICPTPVCFYARFYAWFQIALRLSNAFDVASQRTSMGEMVLRTRPEIVEHFSTNGDTDDGYDYDLINIHVKSAMLAIFLQWGTTGSAVMALYLTPTRGLGCFSSSILLYGCMSTLIWLCLAVSGVLAHISATSRKNTSLRRFRVIGGLSVALRQSGKLLAAINTTWVFISAFLQFSNMEENCYCGAVVLGLGRHGYALFSLTPEQVVAAKQYWAGGVIMASGTALSFIIAINILRRQPQERIRVIHGGYERIPLTPF